MAWVKHVRKLSVLGICLLTAFFGYLPRSGMAQSGEEAVQQEAASNATAPSAMLTVGGGGGEGLLEGRVDTLLPLVVGLDGRAAYWATRAHRN